MLLDRLAPNPMATLNHAVAVAMARGPAEGLAMLEPLQSDERMAGHHRLLAVRAHLHELAGEPAAAATEYRHAARRTTSVPEQRYLDARAAALEAPPS
jgi:predicted RNA polymerase sigma factor